MRLRITPTAFAEIDAVVSFLAQRSPQGARRVAEKLNAAFAMLSVNPRAGRLTDQPGLRRLVLPRSPYLVFYTVQADELVIVAVRHSARRPETMPGH